MPTRTTKKPVAKAAPAKAKAKTATSRNRKAPPSTLPSHKYLSGNALVCGDNLDVLKELPDECIDLLYLDPPFNSNQFYVAAFGDKGMVAQQLKDVWRWTVETENAFQRLPHGKLLDCLRGIRLQTGETSQMAAYCVYMGRRLEQLRRVLTPTGTIYLHCDPHANHYLRLLMDAVFTPKAFRNEIIWAYRGGGVPKSDFARKHDVILRYAKTNKVTFNVDARSHPVFRGFRRKTPIQS